MRSVRLKSPSRPRRPARARIAILAALCLLASTTADAQGRPIQINQKRARIEDVVKRVGEATGRTILFSDEVRGTISIVAKRPVDPDEAWAILESSLSMLGFSLLPSTVDNWRIAKIADSVGAAPFRETAADPSDSFITTLIPLRVAKLQDILKVIEPLSGSRVTLVPYEKTNSLIASGSERAIARLTNIADELDQIEERTLRLRVLRYRDVGEVESFVTTYLDSLGVDGRDLQVWSDERTNSIVVRGGSKGVARVVRFLDDVDQPIEGGGAIRILRVLHRDPEEVAELVRTFADPAGPGVNEFAGTASATVLSGADYSIGVDGSTRSLVVRAEPEVHRAIRSLVEILDEQPELIAVDITVSEVRTPENYGLAFGFQVPFSTGNDTSDLFGAVANPVALGASGLSPTVFGEVTRDSGVSFQTSDGTGGVVTVPVLQSATVAALDFEGTNEVLIQPSLIVTAGEEHEIFVGDNIPIPVTEDSGIADSAAAGVSISSISRTTSFDRRDVGTRLGIEVKTGREGKIQLTLDIEISGIDPTRAAIAGDPREVGPAYTKQELSVIAHLADGESVVLAMNESKKETRVSTGVPFLRDLPFVGWLFRGDGELVEDVRLVIVARTRRVSNPAELVADTIRRRLAFERSSKRESTMPPAEGAPYAVRVTTRSREDDAEAIAESLALKGHETRTHRWTSSGNEYWDVYVTRLDSMVDAAAIAQELSNDGWQADLVVLSARSS